MASCTTSAWVNTAPQVKLTVTESSSTETSATLSWTLQYIASYAASTSVAKSYSVSLGGNVVKEGTYSINGKTGTSTIASGTKTITKTTSSQNISFSCSFSFNLTWSGSYAGTKSASGSISVAAKTSYKVSYNANGGSGAPGTQTKWHGTALTLSSTKPTRTGYTFLGWSTSSTATSATWAAGGSYTTNASDTLYAVWKANTYTVKFNANGGTGAPENQTKTYGKALTLSSTKPTRTNYNFKGWGTSASSTTVSYAAGASYTANAGITLYAIWELAYAKPRITNLGIYRSDASGVASDSGTYAQVSFNWSCDKTISEIAIKWKSTTDSNWSTPVTVSASGTSGTVNQTVGGGAIANDLTYTISISVSDSGGSTPATRTIPGQAFTVDFLSGGKGAAFGKPAEKEGLEVAWPIYAKRVYIANTSDGGAIYGTRSDGTVLGVFEPCNQNGNTTVGYDHYSQQSGDTNIYGNKVAFRTNDGINIGDNKVLTDYGGGYLYGTREDGTVFSVLEPSISGNFSVFGRGNLNGGGITYVMGHNIMFRVSDIASGTASWRPYYQKGYSITGGIDTAGFISAGKQYVYFAVPLDKPVVGNPSVTISTGDGMIIRCNGSFAYGSSDSNKINPSAYSATLMKTHIRIRAQFSTTTNATANAAVGVYWHGTITFG